MSTPPLPEESVEEPNLAGLRQLDFAPECVRLPEPFPSLEFAPSVSETDEATARKESQLALETSDSAQQFGVRDISCLLSVYVELHSCNPYSDR